MSKLSLHMKEWNQCTECYLHETRRKVVHFRGAFPCEVLFIGESPGDSEDVLGFPFVGPAGHKLNQIVEASMPSWAVPLRVGYTNLIGCIPEKDETGKVSQPAIESIAACRPRLTRLIELNVPRAFVLVGRMAGDWWTEAADPVFRSGKINSQTIKTAHIIHPAAIIRLPLASQDLMVKRCVVNLTNLFDELK